MDIAPAQVGNDTILARLGIQQIGQPMMVAPPIQPTPNPIVVQPPPPVVQLQPLAVTPPSTVAPPIELPEKCCAKCAYFRSRVVPGGAIMIGNKPSASEEINECRRFPPVSSSGGKPTFTQVPKREWCGEFHPFLTAEHARIIESYAKIGPAQVIHRTALPKGPTEKIRESADATNSQAGVQSQSDGVGANLPKKRGRPAKGVQAGSPAVQAEAAPVTPKRKGRPARKQEGA